MIILEKKQVEIKIKKQVFQNITFKKVLLSLLLTKAY